MSFIQDHSFHDGKLLSIFLSDNYADLIFEKWDGKKIKLLFRDYYVIKDWHSVGQKISELMINPSTEIIDEAIKTILENGGSEEELVGLKSYSFLNSCGDRLIWEIAARNVTVEELE